MQKLGRYELKDKLGNGAMGVVLRAYDPQVKREVAIKVLHRHLSGNKKIRARFLREVATIARLNHPAIVPIFDAGIDDGHAYLVMQLMEGGSLGSRMRGRPLSSAEIQLLIERIGSALDAVHEQKLVHRDVKPENILYDGNGNPYLADFGVVRLNERGSQFTTVDTVIGTPAYMSPEQAAAGKIIDGRSDLYSLGVVLFEMLTGTIPYEGDSTVGTAVKHIVADIPDIRQHNRELSSQWRKLNEKALAKQPDDRFQSGLALSTAVKSAFAKRGGGSSTSYLVYAMGLMGVLAMLAFVFFNARSGTNQISEEQAMTLTMIAQAQLDSDATIQALQAQLEEGDDSQEIAAQLTEEAQRQADLEAQSTQQAQTLVAIDVESTQEAQMSTAMAESVEVDDSADCRQPDNFAFTTFDPVLDPPRGSEIAADSLPSVAYPIVVTGACPIRVGQLISVKGGQDRLATLLDESGVAVDSLGNGERGVIRIMFDSAAEVQEFDEEWRITVIDEDNFPVEFTPDQEPPTLKLFVNDALGEGWLVQAIEEPVATPIPPTSAPSTNNNNSNQVNTQATQTANAQIVNARNAQATQTAQAQAANARNFQATQTAQAQAANARNFQATQTANAQAEAANIRNAQATQTANAQAANARNFQATQTANAQAANARNAQATQTAQAQAANARNAQATQTANARNAQATQTAQAQAANARNAQATQTAAAASWSATQTAQAVPPTVNVPPTNTPPPPPPASPTPPEFPCGDVRGNPAADFDNDGKPNGVELNDGLDPCNPDTDGDGVPDGIDIGPLDPSRPGSDDGGRG